MIVVGIASSLATPLVDTVPYHRMGEINCGATSASHPDPQRTGSRAPIAGLSVVNDILSGAFRSGR